MLFFEFLYSQLFKMPQTVYAIGLNQYDEQGYPIETDTEDIDEDDEDSSYLDDDDFYSEDIPELE